MVSAALDNSTLNISNLGNADVTKTDTTKNSSNEESMRIFMMSMNSDALPQEDMRYLGQLVSKKTGLSESDAEAKVSKTFSAIKTKLQEIEKSVREAADAARKASAYTALWLFISLLVGAFVASFTATYGARHRRLV